MKKLYDYINENKQTSFLKVVLVFMFIPVVLITCIAAPQIIIEGAIDSTISFGYVLPFGIFMGLTLFPIGYAIIQTWMLLHYIEIDKLFSIETMKKLKNIMYCGCVATILFVGMLPSIFYFAQIDDAPGLMLVGLMFVGGSIAVTVFASLLKVIVSKQIEV